MAETKALFTDLKAALVTAKATEATASAKPNTELETAVLAVEKVLVDPSEAGKSETTLEKELEAMTAFTKADKVENEKSLVYINQYVRSVSSLGQIYLLQAAVDILGLDAATYGVGEAPL